MEGTPFPFLLIFLDLLYTYSVVLYFYILLFEDETLLVGILCRLIVGYADHQSSLEIKLHERLLGGTSRVLACPILSLKSSYLLNRMSSSLSQNYI